MAGSGWQDAASPQTLAFGQSSIFARQVPPTADFGPLSPPTLECPHVPQTYPRYLGILKFYNPRNGYGYITVDPRFVTDDGENSVPSELRVERSEVNAGGQNPGAMQDVAVEFGVWKTSRDVPKA